jgi:predicted transcriptional regulator
MAKAFKTLVQGLSPAAQHTAATRTSVLLAEMPLNELRAARGLTQQRLADQLQVKQPTVAKMEKRTDMYISTLRLQIEAMGGELEVMAKFPEGRVRIQNFASLHA